MFCHSEFYEIYRLVQGSMGDLFATFLSLENSHWQGSISAMLKMPTFLLTMLSMTKFECISIRQCKVVTLYICFLLKKRNAYINHSIQSKLLHLRRKSFYLRWPRPPMTSKESSWRSRGTYVHPLMCGKRKITILQGLVALYETGIGLCICNYCPR